MAGKPMEKVGGWTFVDEKTGTTSIALPSIFDEVYIEVQIGLNTDIRFVYEIPYVALENTQKQYRQGTANNGNYSTVIVLASKSSVTLYSAAGYSNSAAWDATSTSKTRVYVKS